MSEKPVIGWAEKYPRIATKEDLVGESCGIFADIPPAECKNGMKRLTLDVEGKGKRSVLVTDLDIEQILSLRATSPEAVYFFSFVKKQDSEYARPCEV